MGQESLGRAREDLAREGHQALGDVAAVLRRAHDEAGDRQGDLARVCRIAATAIEKIVGDAAAFDRHRERILRYLDQVAAYAQALSAGEDALAPPLLTLPDGDEEKHFRETVAMFAANAVGTVADLEEDILAAESAEQPGEAIAAVRRAIHTIKAEFGVLQMSEAQRLCHEAESAIDAAGEAERPFPVDVMLEVADWLKHFVEALGRDPGAAAPSTAALERKLRALREAAADGRATVASPTPAAGAVPSNAAAPAAAPVPSPAPVATTTSAAPSASTPAPAAPAAAAPAPKPAPAPADSGERVVLHVEGEFADSLNEFISEARSHLGEAEAALLAFENQGADKEQINLTFRAFHTIKGVAGFLHLEPIVELAHVAETVLDAARSDRIELCQDDVDLLLLSGDMMQQLIGSLEGGAAPALPQFRDLVENLRDAASGRVPAARTAPAAAATPAAATSSPAPAAGSAAPAAPASAGADEGDDGGDDTAPATAPAVLQPRARPAAGAAASGAAAAGGDAKTAKIERTIKVSTTRLDMLVDMVGELVIAQSMVLQDPAIGGVANPQLARNIGQVGKITRDLQEAAMSLRMVTVKSTFQKMARLVRDVAGKSGKKVALTIHGEDTELDRNVVEQISDPLVHMIRNAIDHGLETPEVRTAAGKAEEGRLGLRAYHQGGSIVIEIADDGRGIDKDRVLQKAIEKELVPPSTRLTDLSDQEVFAFIFLPGFSTAAKVTDLSGRGVGMDVVRRNIEALRGKIEIESRLGAGTTFRLRLPLTLAIIDGMLLRIGNERYVLPTLSIEQSFRPARKDVHYLADRGECVAVRGEILPVFRLKEIFGQQSGADDLDKGILVVVEVDGDRSCLFADEILGQQQVVIKSLGLQGEKVRGVSGGAIMSDGRVALILDVASVIDAAVAV